MQPSDILVEAKHLLDREIAGQEDAKKAACLLLYHSMNLAHSRPTNLLIAGPTGCGKTYLWQVLARKYPQIKIYDASQISASGWSGSMHLVDIFQDPTLTAGSIIVLDEFDKACQPMTNNRGTAYHELFQNNILAMLNHDTIVFGADNNRSGFKVDCSQMSFVLLGAFEHARETSVSDKKALGFGSDLMEDADADSAMLTDDDFIRSGMRREVLGRMNKIVQMQPLTQFDYEDIALNALSDVRRQIGNDFNLSSDEIALLAHEAMHQRLGARWIKSKLFDMADDMVWQQTWEAEWQREEASMLKQKQEDEKSQKEEKEYYDSIY